MALITQKELQSKGRVEVLLNKLISKSPFTTKDGKQRIFTKVSSVNQQGKIVIYDPLKRSDYTTLLSYLKASTLKMDAVKLFNDKEGTTVALSELIKTDEFGGARKGNKGDMAEVIFAAAVASKFINKTGEVSEQDIKLIINQIDPNKQNQTFKYKSKNKNAQILDDVILEINLSTGNLKALTNPLTWNSLGSIIDASLKYANASNVKELAKTVYENNRYNKIYVCAVGINAQKETKVDIKLVIDDVPVSLISLKAESVKQFGQVGGASFEKQFELWTTLLNINPSEARAKYDLAAKNGDYVAGIAQVYKQVEREFNQRASQLKSRQQLYSDLSEGIKYYATKKEPNVFMVHLSKKEAMVYNFDNLNTLMMFDKDNRLVAKYNPTSYPRLEIMDYRSKQVLISIRVKKEKDYIRNYVEKGKFLEKLATNV